jgi:signal peptidase I
VGKADSGDLKGREGAGANQPTHRHVPSPAAIRETIESVVVAFVLAFLFRTFEAEAFVIPTGSMAPTLMGRHKDLQCPMCGYRFQVSASEEVDQNTNVSLGPRAQVVGVTCPMCHYPIDLAESAGEQREDVQEAFPSFKGDRILVGKFCYQFSEPERWDVAVFKYPGGAKTNFIKRLVGLPNEVVEIRHGDIFTCPLPEQYRNLSESQLGELQAELRKLPKAIARKRRPEKLLAMLQPVYDNDYVLPEIIKLGWPARWQPWPSADGSSEGAWTTSEDYRSFRTEGRAAGETWLRYQHVVPSAYQWQYLQQGKLPPDVPPRRQLISDFYAYNSGHAAKDPPAEIDSNGLHWVGDLAVRCTLEVLSDSGQAVLELVEGGWRMHCRLDVATGKAMLTVEDSARHTAQTIDGKDYGPTAQTAVRGPGKHEIIFSNCDDQLRLWVDGKVVSFDTTTCYAPLNNGQPHDDSFASDFSPVGVGSQGAGLRVSHLKVLRDIYYIAEKDTHFSAGSALTDFQQSDVSRRVLFDSSLWGAFDHMQVVEFPLKQDQFLALGDNSPKSKDGRLWGREGFDYFVRRELLIGKALYIYWPHSWNKLPGTNIPCPMFPNFARMRFVR